MTLRQAQRVLVIGLDCAAPRFIFGPERFHLPNLERLTQSGCWGVLESCHPPITVPAWACMMSGKDPGQLGIYGFRNRSNRSYDEMVTATSLSVREKRVWDIASHHGKKVVVLGVPQTYPARPVNGCLVSCFLAPSTSVDYTYPKALKQELEDVLGEFILDVRDFRTDDKSRLVEQLFTLLENRFAAAKYLIERKPWDFFMMVEMGVDRLHHGFWKYCDEKHPKFVPGNPYRDLFRRYYERVDEHIGELLSSVGDETAVIVVSDHGAKAMYGGVCINQWLIDEGFLTLKNDMHAPTRFEDCAVDWSRTVAWSSGGYYARIFLNVAGRESEGIVSAADYEHKRAEIRSRLEAMQGPDGLPLGNRVFYPADVYRSVEGVAPDLLAYFGDLSWRAVGAVGVDSIFASENDTGPDDANHDYYGIFIMNDQSARNETMLPHVNILDVAPTILSLLGIQPPADMLGSTIE